MREFVRRYGWRAYALPVLVIVTVVALLTVRTPPAGKQGEVAAADGKAAPTPSATASSPPIAPVDIPLKSDASTGTDHTRALKVGELPSGGPYTKYGTGTFRVIKGTTKIVGKSGQLFRYDIEIENGITGIDPTRFAAMVDKTLADPRSWSGHGVRLQRVSSGPVDFHVTMTSTMTVRKYCGYEIPVETSCYVPAGSAGLTSNRVLFNDARWVRGAAPYVGDLNAYRIYLINHEDGHALGHQHAHQCLPGGLAPAMMEQTFGLKSASTGKNCGANPWPYPPGVKGAPGKEQPDTAQNNEYYIND